MSNLATRAPGSCGGRAPQGSVFAPPRLRKVLVIFADAAPMTVLRPRTPGGKPPSTHTHTPLCQKHDMLLSVLSMMAPIAAVYLEPPWLPADGAVGHRRANGSKMTPPKSPEATGVDLSPATSLKCINSTLTPSPPWPKPQPSYNGCPTTYQLDLSWGLAALCNEVCCPCFVQVGSVKLASPRSSTPLSS